MAGPEVALAFEQQRELWPKAAWVLVRRADAEESFLKVLRQHVDVPAAVWRGWWAQRLELLAKIAGTPGVLSVDYETLDQEAVARKIWTHCHPEVAFDVVRWRGLNDLKIEQHIDKRKAREWPWAQ